ncbi:MAG: serine/threonine protein kinase [Deltaproteobacteria bacterium]|nr:serine/threonine protein kinase [Deltaproteobacteria bacterium]
MARLHRHEVDEARALWRQGLATLAAVAGDRVAAPLEGLDPVELAASATAAHKLGFLAELDFLSPEAAAVATFELAAALPPGPVKRELGRQILSTLHSGTADTFVALATSLALSRPRGLSGERVHAKVALALQLPFAAGRRADELALALISRRELVREWLTVPATGSLPQRRLAARLLERAAREAARRANRGDDSGLRAFRARPTLDSWRLLLGERESLVWRHVARARGLLASVDSDWSEEIERDLSPSFSPTEWRRAAASLAARIASDPRSGLLRCKALLGGEIFARDPGVASAMVYGLPAAAEVEVDAAVELASDLIGLGGLDAAEALVDLRLEGLVGPAFSEAADQAAAQLAAAPAHIDDGLLSLREAVATELTASLKDHDSARAAVVRALRAFAGKGELRDRIEHALKAIETAMTTLEACRDSDEGERRRGFAALRDLDASLLETSAVRDLLVATGNDDGLRRLDDLYERLSVWLLGRERDHVTTEGAVVHATLRLRRLKSLVHMVDSDTASGDDNVARTRARRRKATQLLLGRARDDASSQLTRTLIAALARCLDAASRDDGLELSDVVLVIAGHVGDVERAAILSEATMVPELRDVYRAYAELLRSDGRLRVLRDLANALPAASAPRVEALRSALLVLARSAMVVHSAESLLDVEFGEPSALEELERSVLRLAQLAVGARRRLELPWIPPSAGAAMQMLSQVVGRMVAGVAAELAEIVAPTIATLKNELPRVIAEAIGRAVERLAELPASSEGGATLDEARADAPLPSWLPPTRILGGFFIQRAIGRGAGGSVFVACRSDDRHQVDAELFALKVPEYSGAAASALSESEFLRLFREEAGALLSLPEHPNLARFVTFDVGARPKPILVMEMVGGPSLDEIIETGKLTVPDALSVLAGVADALEAMHSGGFAHLDVKPGNIIVRHDGETREIELSGPAACAPVLVDFGLAGRHLRPGCASAHYGAPEIWMAEPVEPQSGPLPADVYAFSCLAFELLTGELLFTGDSPVDTVAAHLAHDGFPDALKRLANGRTEGLAEVLFAGLRKRPSQRPGIRELARSLEQVGGQLNSLTWPVEP